MTHSEGRVPPYNKKAEIACLGCILLKQSTHDEISNIIEAEDFYLEPHRRIYRSMEALIAKDEPVDAVTLGNHLIECGDLEKIGGPMALDRLTSEVVTTTHAGYYAGIVRKRSDQRKTIYAAQQIVARGYGSLEEESDDELEESVRSLVEIVDGMGGVHKAQPTNIFELGDGVVDAYEKVKNGFTGIKFPWDSMTFMTMGMWPGTVTVFVARPGKGKSQVAVLCARHAHFIEEKRVLIISPEMSKEEIAERFFVMESEVSYTNVMRGTLSDFELAKMRGRVDELRGHKGVYIVDAGHDLSPRGLEYAIRIVQPQLVAADALYRLGFPGDEMERTRLAMDWLNRSSKKNDYAACAFTQLNRQAEVSEKKDGGIRLGTIAFADKVAMDAHAVFAMEQDKDMKDDKRMRFIPLKMRRGSDEGPLEVMWDFDKMCFDEVSKENKKYDDDDVPF